MGSVERDCTALVKYENEMEAYAILHSIAYRGTRCSERKRLYLRQKAGWRMEITVKTSRRPVSIRKERIHLEKSPA